MRARYTPPVEVKDPAGAFGIPSMVILALLLVLGFASDMAPGGIYSPLALGIFGLYAMLLARDAPYTFVLMSSFLFLRATMFVSGIAITSNGGGYMPEIATYGAPTGAFVRLALVYVFFTEVSRLLIEPLARRMETTAIPARKTNMWGDIQTHWWVMAFFGACAVLWLAVFAVGVQGGFPLFTGVDRFTFRQDRLDNRLFLAFFSNRPLVVGLAGLIYATCKGQRKRLALAVLLSFLGLSILFSEKFTSIALMLIGFFVPVLALKAKDYPWRNLKNFIPIVLAVGVISAITIPMVLVVYGAREDPVEAMDRFQSRVASQAQLWYMADTTIDYPFNIDTDALGEDWASFWKTGDPVDTMQHPYFGLYNVMIDYTPNDVLASAMDIKLGFTMAFDAYTLKVFGWLGMWPVFALFALINAGALAYLQWAMMTRDPVSNILALKLLVWFVTTLTRGDYYYTLGVKTWIFLAIILGYELLVKGKAREFSR